MLGVLSQEPTLPIKPLMRHRRSDPALTPAIWYAATLLALIAGSLLIRRFQWQGNSELHTVLETIATVLALTAGVIALVRYYARKTPGYLLLGCGFVGAALLDGFHTVITSNWCGDCTASTHPAITAWSGITSRVYLSCLMCCYLISIRRRQNHTTRTLNENAVYVLVGCWTVCSFLFFTLFPLPSAYHPLWIVRRPAGMVAGVLFGMAALGFWQKRTRVDEDLRHWLQWFLIVLAMSELLYMPFSAELYDLTHCVAHGLKIVSYLLALAALLSSMFSVLKREAEYHSHLQRANESLEARVEARTADLEEQGRQIRTANSEIELFLTSIPSILIGLDGKGKITRWNPKASEVFGIPYPDALGRTLYDCGIRWLHPDIDAEIARWLHSETLHRCDDLAYEKDGNARSLGLTVRPILSPQNEAVGFIITGADITERKNAEAALARLAAIVESSDAAIIGTNPEGIIESWNAAAERTYGYSLEEVKGRSVSILWPPELRPELAEILSKLNQSEGIAHVESTRVRKDGERIPVLTTYSPIRDESGKVVSSCSISIDITERKLLEHQLAQSHKLESIGQLAAGIAHEINTPIQYVGDNIRFLRDSFTRLEQLLQGYDRLFASLPGESPSAQFLTEIEALAKATRVDYLRAEIPKSVADSLDGVERVAQIVRAVKEFSHPGPTEKTPLDINRAIKSTVLVCRNEWKYVADLTLDLDEDLPPVRCVPGEFNQVILNLIVNAAHAINDVVSAQPGTKGTITVSTRRDGEHAEVRVRDTGTGIPVEARSSIFNPFFTTKAVGKGTGQGLAMAHNIIVQKHGGEITFETEIGAGTTFQVRLPIGEGAAKDEPRPLQLAPENR
jgi:PAS domain S-box-containing protein